MVLTVKQDAIGERPLELLHGLLGVRQTVIRHTDLVAYAGADVGRRRELMLDPLCATVEEVASREQSAVRLDRIRRPEDLEQKLRRLTRLRFLALRAIAFGRGDARLSHGTPRLPDGGHGSGEEAEHGNGDGGGHGPVAPNEFADAVAEAVLARHHGATVEVATDIAGQLLHGAVAPVHLLLQPAQHDDVEIAGQRAVQSVRRRVPRRRDFGGGGIGVSLADGGGGWPRLLLADRALDLDVT